MPPTPHVRTYTGMGRACPFCPLRPDDLETKEKTVVYQWGEEYLADKSGICPMCDVFIAKNHSRVINLPRPLRPRTSHRNAMCADTGEYYYYDGRSISTHKRWTVHHYCYDKALERIDEENAPKILRIRFGEAA